MPVSLIRPRQHASFLFFLSGGRRSNADMWAHGVDKRRGGSLTDGLWLAAIEPQLIGC
jgi:hypothetical protein